MNSRFIAQTDHFIWNQKKKKETSSGKHLDASGPKVGRRPVQSPQVRAGGQGLGPGPHSDYERAGAEAEAIRRQVGRH
jgi:hypothetical protein